MTGSDLEVALERAADVLRPARRVFVITGAGISADSGLPTYRGVGGLYDDVATPDGLAIEEVLSGPMLRSRPALTWRYLHQIERACRGARPNRAHEVLAAMERRFHHLCVLTQNVDGLHRAAGSQNVIDIHGDVHDLRCTECDLRLRVDDYAGLGDEPRCQNCGAWLRPEVILFGELLPPDKVAHLQDELARSLDVVLSIGTSSQFPYITGPVRAARQQGIPTIEINPGRTDLSPVVDIKIAAGAAAALDALWRRVEAG